MVDVKSKGDMVNMRGSSRHYQAWGRAPTYAWTAVSPFPQPYTSEKKSRSIAGKSRSEGSVMVRFFGARQLHSE